MSAPKTAGEACRERYHAAHNGVDDAPAWGAAAAAAIAFVPSSSLRADLARVTAELAAERARCERLRRLVNACYGDEPTTPALEDCQSNGDLDPVA